MSERRPARKTWTGVYDDSLVCAECEAGFTAYDDYGYRFFHREQFVPIHDGTELVAWQHPTADAGKLKLFVLSILWRAAASNRPEVRSVDLGRWEPEIRRMISSNDPGAPDRFPVVVERFDASPDVTPMFYPYRVTIGDAPCYKMEMAGCTAVTALQGRQWPQVLIDIALAPGRPAYLIPRDYATSPERKRFLAIGAAEYARTGKLPGKRR
jgi:hypothetical protein